MRIGIYICTCLAALTALCACEGPRSFKIDGTISDGANTNLYVRYYGNDALQTGVTVAREGRFEAEFSSADPALVEILDNDLNVLARLYLKNGDKVTVDIDRNNPFRNRVEGDEVNTRWAEMMALNADVLASGDPAAVNGVIDSYISQNPDDVVGTLLFASLYDYSLEPLHADSVLSLIAPARQIASVLAPYRTLAGPYTDPATFAPIDSIRYRTPKSDSTVVFRPGRRQASLLAFSNELSKRSDSVVPHLRRIVRAVPERKLQVLDFSLFTDTGSWKRIVQRDTATWIQGWMPGGVLAPDVVRYAVPRMPYYIVTDSAGRQVYRGASAADAEAAVLSLTK